ncbi:MAG: hypothetical protein NXH75_12335, partial [Halobacteriovoraceae bacterium]|nr:hypothetical protein [Halobacteriovoraceae bacterium]
TNGNYKAQNALASEISIGYSWGGWDLGLDATYTLGRQKDFSFSYGNNNNFIDDFNWHSFNVGPTLKYHVVSNDSTWSYAPFIGTFYNKTALGNSVEFRDQATGEKEDFGQETWGYGGKLGVQFKSYTPDSTWLEAVQYKIFSSYTKYRKTNGYFQNGTTINEFRGNTPDKLEDISIGIMVGFSLGDKIFTKAKKAVTRIADF